MRTAGWLGAVLLAVSLGFPTAAAEGTRSPVTGANRTLTIAAASDLKFALDEVVQALRDVQPGLDVRVTYGSSGSFYSQIASGAPFDLFFSADVEYTRRLAEQGLTLPGGDFIYGVGRIVLWVPRASPLDVSRGLEALRGPAVRRVAIANPRHAPYGRAAEAALRSLGLHEEVKAKLVFGENVAQAAQFVQSGAADAGIIALSLALAPGLSREGRHHEVPLGAYPRLEQGGVILKAARNREAAQALREIMLGPRGRATLARYGFLPPPGR